MEPRALEVGLDRVREDVGMAGCLLWVVQRDRGVGVWSFGLAELPCVVSGGQGL